MSGKTYGELAERSKAVVPKTTRGNTLMGSNPILSSRRLR